MYCIYLLPLEISNQWANSLTFKIIFFLYFSLQSEYQNFNWKSALNLFEIKPTYTCSSGVKLRINKALFM